MFPGIFEFENLGRDKVSKIVKLESEDDFWRAIRPHLGSRDLEWQFDQETNKGKIYAGMFRHVGDFSKLKS